jgi:toxin-antitoxin system PIN domain toxin
LIAVDTNILVYAHRRDMPHHARANGLVESCATGNARWAIPWPCAHEFLAIVSNARVFRIPTPIDKALAQLRAWLVSPTVTLLAEREGYLETLSDLLATSRASGAKIHDARIAALCIGYGVSELWSADRDFGRFPRLRTRNPLAD